MIETLEDIIEQLADRCDVYGIGVDGEHGERCQCRMCWTYRLRERILAAVEIERKLSI